MRHRLRLRRLSTKLIPLGTAAAAAAVIVAGAYWASSARSANVTQATPGAPPLGDSPSGAAQTVRLSDAQLGSIKVGPVVDHDFSIQKEAVGSIDFNEDMNVHVFTPYQGRIIQLYADLGDEVKKGQILFTIESPDFIASQANLIAAAGTLDQTSSALLRAKKLYAIQGIDQNDYETAVANEQAAEGALRAARNAVAIFGKTEAEIDQIVATRHVETALIVKSPITGHVTARNAAPGLLEQPGNEPAPYSVADLSTMWLMANALESDSPDFKVGQDVTVSVMAYPGHLFNAKITAIGATVDPNSRRITIRSEIKDREHLLRAGMFATFVIRTGESVRAPAIPLNGVVREADGTNSVWVATSDRHRFARRTVRIGLQRDGYDQLLEGVQSGDFVAVDGAIFLSNMIFGGAS
jgi:cobalt-zinc-cadmium efflux system membrane fusion protein